MVMILAWTDSWVRAQPSAKQHRALEKHSRSSFLLLFIPYLSLCLVSLALSYGTLTGPVHNEDNSQVRRGQSCTSERGVMLGIY